MNFDYIIWDFNGTILDDVETGILSVNKLLRDRGLPMIDSKERYRSVFGFPIKDYYARLGFDFAREPYEVIAPLWVEQYMLNVENARVFEDVRSTLGFFAERGAHQVLLSATELGMLKGQLEKLGLSDSFEEIMGLGNIHAASKQGLAEEWRSRHKNARVLLIGDTDHDLQVARAIGAECVLISRGHQSSEYLRGLGACVFSSLGELIKEIGAE